MYGICAGCGAAGVMDGASSEEAVLTCGECGYEQSYHRLPLFVVVGASGTGKSTVVKELVAMPDPPDVVALDSDILLIVEYAGSGWDPYRETWVWFCFNIVQSGRPVALFGGGDPADYAGVSWMRYFSETRYLALTCEATELERRLRARPARRKSARPDFIGPQLEWNAALGERATTGHPKWDVVDTTDASPADTARDVARWIEGSRPW